MLDALKSDDLPVIFALGLSALSIVLGFVALLTQRIYIDASTQKPVDVDIPLLGRMRTNYPALVFVFLGFFLTFYVLQKLPSEESGLDWVVQGSFSDTKINNWNSGGTLELHPPIGPRLSVGQNGTFTITMKTAKDKTFEQMVEKITYTHNEGQIDIFPRVEYSAWEQNKADSKLVAVTLSTRKYKPVPLERLSPSN